MYSKQILGSFLSICLFITTVYCGDTTMQPSQPRFQSDSITQKEWDRLSSKKIYFGHMSVGRNIIDGINDLMQKNSSIRLNIQESTDINKYTGGAFLHSKNGRNGDPKSKIDAFASTMNSGMGNRADIAFFKFCYVDITESTDVKDIFNYYKTAMNGLVKKYPKTAMPHTTVPLTTEAESLGLKERAKDIIKKS